MVVKVVLPTLRLGKLEGNSFLVFGDKPWRMLEFENLTLIYGVFDAIIDFYFPLDFEKDS